MLMTPSDLAQLLRETADAIERDDSWEGSLSWTMLHPEVPKGQVDVEAAIRTNNASGGQGSLKLIPTEFIVSMV